MKKAVSNFEAAFLFKIYLGPADLFGGRSPPAGGSGFSLQSFLLRRQANQKRIFTSPPNAIELIINYFANQLLFLFFNKKPTFLLQKFQRLGSIIRIFAPSKIKKEFFLWKLQQ
jgi:hypothetical protein